MKIVSVINYKGGVGKTSLAANLAGQLAWMGRKVLVLDFDPQTSLTFSLIKADTWEKSFASQRTIKTWFESFDAGAPISLASLVHTPVRVASVLDGRGRLDMISSHLGLINVDLELATKLGGANLAQAKMNFIKIHRRLADGFANDDDLRDRGYDLVLFDCPPNFNIVTKTAIVASDYILVPTRPDYLSTLGIDYLIRSVNGLVKDYNDYASVDGGGSVAKIDPKVLGVVFTMIQEYNGIPIASQRPYMARVRRMPDLSVFDSYIKRNDTLFASAPEAGIPVVLNGYSTGSHQSVVDGLADVTDEFVTRIGL